MISYWRSIEHVHAYAHSPLHEKAWLWWDKSLASHKHIGLYHEVFESPKGMWEGIYINFQPTLLGATTYLKKGGELKGGQVKHEWVSGLLDANRGRMKTSNGRRGQTGRDTDEDKFGANYYEDNAANYNAEGNLILPIPSWPCLHIMGGRREDQTARTVERMNRI